MTPCVLHSKHVPACGLPFKTWLFATFASERLRDCLSPQMCVMQDVSTPSSQHGAASSQPGDVEMGAQAAIERPSHDVSVHEPDRESLEVDSVRCECCVRHHHLAKHTASLFLFSQNSSNHHQLACSPAALPVQA